MKYSIIIAAYNAESYLIECLSSILAQKYTDYEVIVVNDGSTDYTSRICEMYAAKDSRIKYIEKVNEGVSIARNIGIEASQGEYITFVDADDWVENNYLETIDRNMEDYDLIFFGNIEHYKERTKKIFCPPRHTAREQVDIESILFGLIKNECMYEFFGYTWNKCFRASIIRQHNIRFVEHLSLREDEVFTDCVCRHIKSVKTIDDAIYNYRCFKSGLTFRLHSGKEMYLLAQKLDEATNGIVFRPLYMLNKCKVFDYIFKATTNMHTAEALSFFPLLYDMYHDRYEFMDKSNRRFKKIFCKPRWLAEILFLRKYKRLRNKYHTV